MLRNLPSNHPKIPLITEELKKRTAGYRGETALDFPLSFIAEKDYFIFHDLRLQDSSRYFQMDTLVLSQKFALILEVKNIAGSLYFDPTFNQLIRTKDGTERAFPDPILQIERQEIQLRNWLSTNRLRNVPVFSFVVISNPETIIRTSPENRDLDRKVIHRDALPAKIIQLENTIKEQAFSEKEFKKAVRAIKRLHIPEDYPILEKYQIKKAEILKGAVCLHCNHRPLLRTHGTWICEKCLSKTQDAHIQPLKDYSLLINSTITNHELRDYLDLQSSAVAKRIMQSMNLTYSGLNKGRVYHLSFDKS